MSRQSSSFLNPQQKELLSAQDDFIPCPDAGILRQSASPAGPTASEHSRKPSGAVERGPCHRPQAPHRPGTASEPLLAPAAFPSRHRAPRAQGGCTHGSAMAQGTPRPGTHLGRERTHKLAEISSSKTKMGPCLDSDCRRWPGGRKRGEALGSEGEGSFRGGGRRSARHVGGNLTSQKISAGLATGSPVFFITITAAG